MPELEQMEIPIPEQPEPKSVPGRIRTKVTHADNKFIKLQVYLNGDLITGDNRLTIRLADFAYLMILLQPEIIIVDRENVTDVSWKILRTFPQVELI